MQYAVNLIFAPNLMILKREHFDIAHLTDGYIHLHNREAMALILDDNLQNTLRTHEEK